MLAKLLAVPLSLKNVLPYHHPLTDEQPHPSDQRCCGAAAVPRQPPASPSDKNHHHVHRSEEQPAQPTVSGLKVKDFSPQKCTKRRRYDTSMYAAGEFSCFSIVFRHDQRITTNTLISLMLVSHHRLNVSPRASVHWTRR